MTAQTKIEIGLDSKTFDNQALEHFRSCPQYYYWRIEKKIEKARDKKTAADFGSSIHSALEHYYKNGMTDPSIVEGTRIFIEKFSPYQDDTDDKRTLAKGIEILLNYFERYRQEPFNVVTTEIGGAVELGPYLYVSRIDLAVEWLSPKGIYGIDHKTTSSIKRTVAKPHNQITGYCYTLSQTYLNVLGFILNMIGVYKDEEEIDKTAPKVPSSKTGKLIYAKKKREVLVRMPTTRTQVEIDQWKRETLHLISQIEQCREKGVWPKHSPNYCTAYRGLCQYLDLCLAQDPDAILEPLLVSEVYLVNPWCPYHPIDEEEEET